MSQPMKSQGSLDGWLRPTAVGKSVPRCDALIWPGRPMTSRRANQTALDLGGGPMGGDGVIAQPSARRTPAISSSARSHRGCSAMPPPRPPPVCMAAGFSPATSEPRHETLPGRGVARKGPPGPVGPSTMPACQDHLPFPKTHVTHGRRAWVTRISRKMIPCCTEAVSCKPGAGRPALKGQPGSGLRPTARDGRVGAGRKSDHMAPPAQLGQGAAGRVMSTHVGTRGGPAPPRSVGDS